MVTSQEKWAQETASTAIPHKLRDNTYCTKRCGKEEERSVRSWGGREKKSRTTMPKRHSKSHVAPFSQSAIKTPLSTETTGDAKKGDISSKAIS